MDVKIKDIIYVMMIITGLLIEKYGMPGANPKLAEYFGWGAISLGSINIVIDYFKKPKK